MAELPQEKRDLIVQLFENGETNKTEIARQAVVSKPTVYKVLEEEGLYEPPDAREEDDDEGWEFEEEPEDAEDGEISEQHVPALVQVLILAGALVGSYLVLRGRPHLIAGLFAALGGDIPGDEQPPEPPVNPG